MEVLSYEVFFLFDSEGALIEDEVHGEEDIIEALKEALG